MIKTDIDVNYLTIGAMCLFAAGMTRYGVGGNCLRQRAAGMCRYCQLREHDRDNYKNGGQGAISSFHGGEVCRWQLAMSLEVSQTPMNMTEL